MLIIQGFNMPLLVQDRRSKRENKRRDRRSNQQGRSYACIFSSTPWK